MKNQYNLPCNIAQSLNIIGDKWTLLILHAIKADNHTYKDLQSALRGIPTNLLSSRLKSLEEDGLIRCELYQNHPPRYAYYLCEAGEDLDDVFHAIVLWGERNLHKCYKKLVHKECQHHVDIQYYCEHCGKVVTKEDIAVMEVDEVQESK